MERLKSNQETLQDMFIAAKNEALDFRNKATKAAENCGVLYGLMMKVESGELTFAEAREQAASL